MLGIELGIDAQIGRVEHHLQIIVGMLLQFVGIKHLVDGLQRLLGVAPRLVIDDAQQRLPVAPDFVDAVDVAKERDAVVSIGRFNG